MFFYKKSNLYLFLIQKVVELLYKFKIYEFFLNNGFLNKGYQKVENIVEN